MTKRLQSIFNIEAGEGRMVALVLAYAIALYFSNMMARTASSGLFFGEYDAKTLPYTYIFLMVIGPLVSMIYLRLNNRFSLSAVLIGIHVFLLLNSRSGNDGATISIGSKRSFSSSIARSMRRFISNQRSW